MNGTLPVPPAPRGPGVRVPFPSPPTERDRKRLWISLGVGGAALLLCCGGGIAGFVGLAVASQRAIPAEARTVVQNYLDGLRQRDFRKAYDQVCTSRQNQQTLDEFSAVETDRPRITSFQLEEPVVHTNVITVTADVREADGGGGAETYTVISDRQAGELRVCGGPR
jgi:hypothetical protein